MKQSEKYHIRHQGLIRRAENSRVKLNEDMGINSYRTYIVT